jgi:hypothetical protein
LSNKKKKERKITNLVEIFSAALCAAETVNLFVLDGELVVVGDLLPEGDRLLGVDDNLLFAVDGDDLRVAVRLKIENVQTY